MMGSLSDLYITKNRNKTFSEHGYACRGASSGVIRQWKVDLDPEHFHACGYLVG